MIAEKELSDLNWDLYGIIVSKFAELEDFLGGKGIAVSDLQSILKSVRYLFPRGSVEEIDLVLHGLSKGINGEYTRVRRGLTDDLTNNEIYTIIVFLEALKQICENEEYQKGIPQDTKKSIAKLNDFLTRVDRPVISPNKQVEAWTWWVKIGVFVSLCRNYRCFI